MFWKPHPCPSLKTGEGVFSFWIWEGDLAILKFGFFLVLTSGSESQPPPTPPVQAGSFFCLNQNFQNLRIIRINTRARSGVRSTKCKELQAEFALTAANSAACQSRGFSYRGSQSALWKAEVIEVRNVKILFERSASLFWLDFFGSFCVKTKRTQK